MPRSFGWHFRYVKLGIIEQRQLERPANGPHILLRKDQLGDPLPLAAPLSFLADTSHVVDRIADGAQRAAVLGWEWLV